VRGKRKPTQWARACSPGRVREPWEPGRGAHRKAAPAGDSTGPGNLRARNIGVDVDAVARRRARDARVAVPRARGLALGYTLSPAGAGSRCARRGSQGSRTRPGLHAVARWRELAMARVAVPRARGLALGYMLSPAGAGSRCARRGSQGSRTRPGLHAVARWRGLAMGASRFPGLADSPWATRCRPPARARYRGT